MKHLIRRNSDEESLTLKVGPSFKNEMIVGTRELKVVNSSNAKPLYDSKLDCTDFVQPESRMQRVLWILNLTATALVWLMYHDNPTVSMRQLITTVVPLLLQMQYLYNSGYANNRLVLFKLAIAVSLMSSLISTIVIAQVVIGTLEQADPPVKIWAPAIVIQTWRIMYTVKYTWLVFVQFISALSCGTFCFQ